MLIFSAVVRLSAFDFTHKRGDKQHLIFAATLGVSLFILPTAFLLLSIRSFYPHPLHPSTLRTMDDIDVPYNATPAGRIFVQPNRHDVLCGRGKVRNRAYFLAFQDSLICFPDVLDRILISFTTIISHLTHSFVPFRPSLH
jgi:hypothetical protein